MAHVNNSIYTLCVARALGGASVCSGGAYFYILGCWVLRLHDTINTLVIMDDTLAAA